MWAGNQKCMITFSQSPGGGWRVKKWLKKRGTEKKDWRVADKGRKASGWVRQKKRRKGEGMEVICGEKKAERKKSKIGLEERRDQNVEGKQRDSWGTSGQNNVQGKETEKTPQKKERNKVEKKEITASISPQASLRKKGKNWGGLKRKLGEVRKK